MEYKTLTSAFVLSLLLVGPKAVAMEAETGDERLRAVITYQPPVETTEVYTLTEEDYDLVRVIKRLLPKEPTEEEIYARKQAEEKLNAKVGRMLDQGMDIGAYSNAIRKAIEDPLPSETPVASLEQLGLEKSLHILNDENATPYRSALLQAIAKGVEQEDDKDAHALAVSALQELEKSVQQNTSGEESGLKAAFSYLWSRLMGTSSEQAKTASKASAILPAPLQSELSKSVPVPPSEASGFSYINPLTWNWNIFSREPSNDNTMSAEGILNTSLNTGVPMDVPTGTPAINEK